MKHPGFTLAELLIALALLGIIAAFTIPKVLQASVEQERVAKLRETVATLESAWYAHKAENQVTPGRLADFIYPRLQCVAQPAPETCQLANGVTIVLGNILYSAAMLANPSVVLNTIVVVDVNGNEGPNTPGQDQFCGDFNLWGDFDGPGALYTFSANSKNFHWGNQTETAYNSGGFGPYPALATPDTAVGYWLTR